MENNKTTQEQNQKDAYTNTGAAYSGSGSMSPGGETGADKCPYHHGEENRYVKERENENPEGKSIAEATDPSKLSDI